MHAEALVSAGPAQIVVPLQAKNVLSTGVVVLHAPAVVSAQPIQLIVPLDGMFHGQFAAADNAAADVATAIALTGSGRIRRIGKFALSGTENTPGAAQVTLVLKGSEGTMTVKLTAFAGAPGAAVLPVRYSYSIVSGTGMYTNAIDHGTATLTELVSKAGATSAGEHGHFRLVFTSSFPEPTG